MEEVLVLINRRARKGAVDPDIIARVFRSRGGRADIHFPESPERMREIISARAKEVRAVVIGGGDGSLNAAIEPVIAAGAPLGILPLGTANDLARTLGIPIDLDSAAAIVMRGHTRRVDVGRVNGSLFLNAAHLGLGSRIAANLRPRAKSTWGVPAYIGAFWGAVRRNRPFRAEIVTRSARVKVNTIEVAVGNGPRYGGGMRMQDAAIDDHLLHVYSLRPMRVREMIPVLVRLRRGTYADDDKVDVLAAERFELRTTRPRWITVDGERRTHTPAQFRVLSSALQVLAPPVEPDGIKP